jgi:hypothetical protein
VASQSFSKLSRKAHAAFAIGVTIALGALLVLDTASCVTVRPEDKEFLAQPSMTFGSDGRTRAHDEHVFSNREGSFGAGGVSGGGCGCN